MTQEKTTRDRNRQIFNRSLADFILNQLTTAPESQISISLRDRTAQFVNKDYTATQAYDFLADLAKKPKIEISGFVKVLCDVEKFYSRPPHS